MSDISTLEDKAAELGRSLSWWNSVLVWSLLVALIAGVVTFLAQRQTISRTRTLGKVNSEIARVKEQSLQRDLKDKDVQIAKVQESAANANQRAEEARLKTAQIQALVEWRTLSQDQMAKLHNALSARPSSVKFIYVSNDPEALFLAIQLSNKAFTNWNVTSESRDFSGTMVFGLRIEGTSEQDVNFVRDAFRSADVPFSTEPIPPHGGSVGFGAVIEGQPEPTVEIIVGSKPRPLP
jgi:hypothetical protein